MLKKCGVLLVSFTLWVSVTNLEGATKKIPVQTSSTKAKGPVTVATPTSPPASSCFEVPASAVSSELRWWETSKCVKVAAGGAKVLGAIGIAMDGANLIVCDPSQDPEFWFSYANTAATIVAYCGGPLGGLAALGFMGVSYLAQDYCEGLIKKEADQGANVDQILANMSVFMGNCGAIPDPDAQISYRGVPYTKLELCQTMAISLEAAFSDSLQDTDDKKVCERHKIEAGPANGFSICEIFRKKLRKFCACPPPKCVLEKYKNEFPIFYDAILKCHPELKNPPAESTDPACVANGSSAETYKTRQQKTPVRKPVNTPPSATPTCSMPGDEDYDDSKCSKEKPTMLKFCIECECPSANPSSTASPGSQPVTYRGSIKLPMNTAANPNRAGTSTPTPTASASSTPTPSPSVCVENIPPEISETCGGGLTDAGSGGGGAVLLKNSRSPKINSQKTVNQRSTK